MQNETKKQYENKKTEFFARVPYVVVPGIAFAVAMAFEFAHDSHTAQAEVAKTIPPKIAMTRKFDRLALALVGSPATPAQKASLPADRKGLETLAEELRRTPAFQQRLADFWLQILKISANVEPYSLMTDPTNAHSTYAVETRGNGTLPMHEYMSFYFQRGIIHHDKKCQGRPLVTTWCYGDRQPCHSEVGTATPCEKTVVVTPYYNSDLEFAVPAMLLQEDFCGKSLEKCFPTDIRRDPIHGGTFVKGDHFETDIVGGFTREPGELIAKVVADGRPWKDTLTGTQSVLNGSQVATLKKWNKVITAVSPPGTYRKTATDPSLTLPALASNDRAYAWVERGPLHAGILSTLAFQRTNNGWRAKANRAREALLCRKYVAPAGAKQIPSDEANLAKRPYCSSCHVSIEPMSQFFGRWPKSGTNYAYDASDKVNDAGSYDGVSGQGIVDFARIFAATDDFKHCAVERAFEFISGRSMTLNEDKLLKPQLLTAYAKGGETVWPVMLEIIRSGLFD